MLFDSRIGMGGLIMAFLGIALPLLFPDKKWIGWICLAAGAVLGLIWITREIPSGKPWSFSVVIASGAFLGVIAASIIYASLPSVPPVPHSEHAATTPLGQSETKEISNAPINHHEVESPKPSAPHTRAPKPPTTDHIATLKDLFLSDFPMLKMHGELNLESNTGEKITLISQAYFDFNGRSSFVGFFIPSSVRNVYDVCSYLATVDHAYALKHTGAITSGGLAGQMTKQEDLDS